MMLKALLYNITELDAPCQPESEEQALMFCMSQNNSPMLLMSKK